MILLLTLGLVGVLDSYGPALRGPDTSLRSEALVWLAELGDRAAIPLGRALDRVGWRAREGIIDVLSRTGTASVPILVHTARSHARRDARRLAIRALGDVGGATARNTLPALLGGRERDLVLEALGKVGGMVDAPAVSGFLRDELADVRRQAVVALGKLLGVSAAGRIVDALSDGHHSVRYAAAETLVGMGDQGGEALMARLGELQGPARQLGFRTLGKLRYAGATSTLVASLGELDWGLRAAAADALADLGDRRNRVAVAEASARERHPFARKRMAAAMQILAVE